MCIQDLISGTGDQYTGRGEAFEEKQLVLLMSRLSLFKCFAPTRDESCMRAGLVCWKNISSGSPGLGPSNSIQINGPLPRLGQDSPGTVPKRNKVTLRHAANRDCPKGCPPVRPHFIDILIGCGQTGATRVAIIFTVI